MKQELAALAVLLALLGAATPALADPDLQAMKREISKRLPGASVDYVKPSPVKGIYQVGVDGGDIVYVSADGRYLLSGTLIDLETKEDRTERVLAGQRVTSCYM